MAKAKDQQTRDEMIARGVPREHHDELAALRADAEAKGFGWDTVLTLVVEYGPAAVAIIRRLLKREKAG